MLRQDQSRYRTPHPKCTGSMGEEHRGEEIASILVSRMGGSLAEDTPDSPLHGIILMVSCWRVIRAGWGAHAPPPYNRTGRGGADTKTAFSASWSWQSPYAGILVGLRIQEQKGSVQRVETAGSSRCPLLQLPHSLSVRYVKREIGVGFSSRSSRPQTRGDPWRSVHARE